MPRNRFGVKQSELEERKLAMDLPPRFHKEHPYPRGKTAGVAAQAISRPLNYVRSANGGRVSLGRMPTRAEALKQGKSDNRTADFWSVSALWARRKENAPMRELAKTEYYGRRFGVK